jgi:hypothetical protein
MKKGPLDILAIVLLVILAYAVYTSRFGFGVGIPFNTIKSMDILLLILAFMGYISILRPRIPADKNLQTNVKPQKNPIVTSALKLCAIFTIFGVVLALGVFLLYSLSPSHLSIEYTNSPSIYSTIVKTFGTQISLCCSSCFGFYTILSNGSYANPEPILYCLDFTNILIALILLAVLTFALSEFINKSRKKE